MPDQKNVLPLSARLLAVTDTETTGLLPGHHEIIEIATHLVEPVNLEVVKTLEFKVIPCHPERMSPEALAVNGYQPDAWTSARPLDSVMRDFADATPDAIFMSWGAAFDWPFVDAAFRQTGVQPKMDYHRLCAMTMAWTLLAPRGLQLLKQDRVAEFLGLQPEPPVHRAINGANLTLAILRRLRQLKP